MKVSSGGQRRNFRHVLPHGTLVRRRGAEFVRQQPQVRKMVTRQLREKLKPNSAHGSRARETAGNPSSEGGCNGNLNMQSERVCSRENMRSSTAGRSVSAVSGQWGWGLGLSLDKRVVGWGTGGAPQEGLNSRGSGGRGRVGLYINP